MESPQLQLEFVDLLSELPDSTLAAQRIKKERR
jgi:hypothetical protein